jgi:hypothetical protein
MPADDISSRLAYVEHCIRRIRATFQAIGPEYDVIHEDLPRNLFPSGALFPSPGDTLVEELEEDFGQTSYRPSAIGLVVRTENSDELTVSLEANFSLYYPAFPSHDEVVHFVQRYGQGGTIKMPPKYKRIASRIPLTAVTIPLGETDGFQVLSTLSQAFRTTLGQAQTVAYGDPDLYGLEKGKPRRGRAKTYLRADLMDAGEWAKIVARSTRRVEPRWFGEILYRVRKDGNGWLVEFMICNTTPEVEQAWVLEEVFIGSKLSLKAKRGVLSPILLRQVESRDYRYDPRTWASGRNCDVDIHVGDDAIQVSTESIPLYVQKRVRQQVWRRKDGSSIDPTFEGLSGDHAIPLLQDIAAAMRAYLQNWDSKVGVAPGVASSPQQVLEAKQAFSREVERFDSGVEILSNPGNKDLLSAFQLTNQAFHRRFSQMYALASAKAGGPPKLSAAQVPGWRLFQVVFLVSEIGDLSRRDARFGNAQEPEPTVIWFPTGSGKTEAYLGLIVFHAFWDRLRGKPYGVTAIAKFPLRLLSLQQFSRVVGVMEYAEDIRKSSPLLEGHRGDPFSVGYYAGAGNTLNLLDRDVSPDNPAKPSSLLPSIARMTSDPQRLERECLRHRKVYYCPSCIGGDGNPGRIQTTFDPSKPGFIHKCQNCGRVLQLHVTDTEVLRWLPTLVIATIDKLARLATEPWGRTMFGEAKVHCPLHGYLIQRPVGDDGVPTKTCPVLSCGKPLSDSPPNVDPVPGLLVQDELHLLTETLGAFASHYETMFVEALRKKEREGVGRGAWKIVGSTATVEGYRQLVLQLYNRSKANRFPCPGPNAMESFYVIETEEPQRMILGVRPHGLSHVDTVMKVLLEIHRQVAPLADPGSCAPGTALPQPLQGISDPERLKLSRRYRTVVTYGINRNEVQQVNRSYVGQLNPYMRRDGLSEFQAERVKDLTGDSAIIAIQEFLDVMENGQDEGYYQAVTATSIIGHGVDLDNLNTIIFRGIPHTVAEYIQAMSRVGRKDGVPALVVNVYNPNRERDSSHFESHRKYLEFRELLLRNIPTTRYSRQALEKTLPGLVLQFVNYESPLHDMWKRTTVSGLLKEVRDQQPEVLKAVRRRLGIPDSPCPDASLVKRQDSSVERQLANIRTELQRTPAGSTQNEPASQRLRALRSLRDTDVAVNIYSEDEALSPGEF